jgi:hypothetical protein
VLGREGITPERLERAMRTITEEAS